MLDNWAMTADKLPPFGMEVLGYHPTWEDEDYNPSGICMCFVLDNLSWTRAKWCGYHDEYHTICTNIEKEDQTDNVPPLKWCMKSAC